MDGGLGVAALRDHQPRTSSENWATSRPGSTGLAVYFDNTASASRWWKRWLGISASRASNSSLSSILPDPSRSNFSNASR